MPPVEVGPTAARGSGAALPPPGARAGRRAPCRPCRCTRTMRFVEVDAAALEADRLAHPQAAPVQELDEGPVAERARGRAVRRLDQALDLAERQRAGKPLAPPRQVDLGGGVVRPLAEQRSDGGRRSRAAAAGARSSSAPGPRPRRSASQPSMSSARRAAASVPGRPPGRRGRAGTRRPSVARAARRAARGSLDGRIGHVRSLTPGMAAGSGARVGTVIDLPSRLASTWL